MKPSLSVKRIRKVLDACADCDTCRFLMEDDCPVFPLLYGLYDGEREEGRTVETEDLRELAQRCTLCGLCPCPDIREDLILGRTEIIEKEGMPLSTRLLADVQRFGRWGSRFSGLYNRLLSVPGAAGLAKRVGGIHRERALPEMPGESFFQWAEKQGLDRLPDDQGRVPEAENQNPKAAYFAGCTAGYLFPEVGKAAVRVLAENGISVHVPPQQCCGMPTLLEGDRETTLARVRRNLEGFLRLARAGYEIVCSCPTCGFLLKVLLREKAFYSPAYQQSVDAGSDEIKIPAEISAIPSQAGGLVSLKKSLYKNILKDDGYFSSLDPLERIELSDHVTDMGAYLARLYRNGRLSTEFSPIEGRYVYYAPCHQREQEIGSPYFDLLGLIPGLSIQKVGGSLDCCGMGGSLGLKKGFHRQSLEQGERLARKIRAAQPHAVVTDCLSCRLQFNHLLPLPVFHPLELLFF